VEQVEIQHRAGAAWLARAEGRNADAVALMRSAAELEDSTEKHNITPGPIATARELLADLLLEMGQPAQAAREYERSLDRAPNRLKALHGVARASELAGDRDRARVYYGKLLALTKPTEAERPEVREARTFLAR
jgi:tetratricopeptide (TPR) repeat protein